MSNFPKLAHFLLEGYSFKSLKMLFDPSKIQAEMAFYTVNSEP